MRTRGRLVDAVACRRLDFVSSPGFPRLLRLAFSAPAHHTARFGLCGAKRLNYLLGEVLILLVLKPVIARYAIRVADRRLILPAYGNWFDILILRTVDDKPNY